MTNEKVENISKPTFLKSIDITLLIIGYVELDDILATIQKKLSGPL